jgi:hypothetical protein
VVVLRRGGSVGGRREVVWSRSRIGRCRTAISRRCSISWGSAVGGIVGWGGISRGGTTNWCGAWAGRCWCNVSWRTAGLHCAGEGWSWRWGAGHWDRAGYHDDGASIRSESGRTLGRG